MWPPQESPLRPTGARVLVRRRCWPGPLRPWPDHTPALCAPLLVGAPGSGLESGVPAERPPLRVAPSLQPASAWSALSATRSASWSTPAGRGKTAALNQTQGAATSLHERQPPRAQRACTRVELVRRRARPRSHRRALALAPPRPPPPPLKSLGRSGTRLLPACLLTPSPPSLPCPPSLHPAAGLAAGLGRQQRAPASTPAPAAGT